MTELMQQFQGSTGSIQNPVLRRQVQKAFENLGEIKTEVVGVAQAREMLKPLRERVHAGGIALIADRGNVDLSGTTVMIAAATLQDFIIDIIDQTMKASTERESFTDLLAGLQPVPQAAADFEVDFAAARLRDFDRSTTGIDL
jgi:hypothetical protein